MDCERCKNKVIGLVQVPYKLINLFRFQNLCSNCDSELRKIHLEQVEKLLGYKGIEFQNEHNGAVFHSIKTVNKYNGVCCFGQEKRIIITGNLLMNYTENSWKFGNEIQFKIRTHKSVPYKLEERNNSDYNTVEMCISTTEIDKVIAFFKEVKRMEAEKK